MKPSDLAQKMSPTEDAISNHFKSARTLAKSGTKASPQQLIKRAQTNIADQLEYKKLHKQATLVRNMTPNMYDSLDDFEKGLREIVTL